MRKQLSTKNSKSNEGRQDKNGGVKGRNRSAEEFERETDEEQTTVDRSRRKDRLPKRTAELREEGRPCRINHGADGARAGGPPAEGAPEQNIFW